MSHGKPPQTSVFAFEGAASHVDGGNTLPMTEPIIELPRKHWDARSIISYDTWEGKLSANEEIERSREIKREKRKRKRKKKPTKKRKKKRNKIKCSTASIPCTVGFFSLPLPFATSHFSAPWLRTNLANSLRTRSTAKLPSLSGSKGFNT
jgi:hypothetical protein